MHITRHRKYAIEVYTLSQHLQKSITIILSILRSFNKTEHVYLYFDLVYNCTDKVVTDHLTYPR